VPLTDEAEYFDTRSEQLARKLQDEHGLSRRQLLKLGAAGSGAAAGLRAVAADVRGAFSHRFNAGGELAVGLAWLAVLSIGVYLVLRRAVRVSG